MTISIVPANLESQSALIVETLRRCLTTRSDLERFDWLYINCPYGRARAWLVFDNNRAAVVGVAAAFPRRIYVGERDVTAWVFGDFCLDKDYRCLGPALELQKACLSVLDTEEYTFCYDFPSPNMAAVYKRIGFDVTARMLRLAKPLRVDRKIKEMTKNSAARWLGITVGNTLLKIASPRGNAEESLELSLHTQVCGEEFTVLAQEQGAKFGICLQRSAEYLNWRYIDNPLVRHEIVTARKNGRLVGYVVWTQAGDDAFIVDLFCEQDAAIVRCLVAEIVFLAQERDAMSVSVWIEKSHPWRSLFVEIGFRLRESTPMMIIPSKSFAYKINGKPTGSYLMHGDRDS